MTWRITNRLRTSLSLEDMNLTLNSLDGFDSTDLVTDETYSMSIDIIHAVNMGWASVSYIPPPTPSQSPFLIPFFPTNSTEESTIPPNPVPVIPEPEPEPEPAILNSIMPEFSTSGYEPKNALVKLNPKSKTSKRRRNN